MCIRDRAWTSVAWAVGKDRETKQHLNSVAPLTGTLGLSYTQKGYGADLMLTACLLYTSRCV